MIPEFCSTLFIKEVHLAAYGQLWPKPEQIELGCEEVVQLQLHGTSWEAQDAQPEALTTKRHQTSLNTTSIL